MVAYVAHRLAEPLLPLDIMSDPAHSNTLSPAAAAAQQASIDLQVTILSVFISILGITWIVSAAFFVYQFRRPSIGDQGRGQIATRDSMKIGLKYIESVEPEDLKILRLLTEA
jgi:hypothetical protein